jgi:hypothetical protein
MELSGMFQWLRGYCHTITFHSLVIVINTWLYMAILRYIVYLKLFPRIFFLSSEAKIKINYKLKKVKVHYSIDPKKLKSWIDYPL